MEDFGDKMKYVYNNYSEAQIKADRFMKDVNERYTWDRCVDKMYEILNDIRGGLGG